MIVVKKGLVNLNISNNYPKLAWYWRKQAESGWM